MTDRLAAIESRLHAVSQLGNVVTAMRGIAASRAQASRDLLPAIDAYSRAVAEAIAAALPLAAEADAGAAAPRGGRSALILFGAEAGFAGAFADHGLDAVADRPADAALFLIGSRSARLAAERGERVAWQAPMASHAGAIAALANQVAEALFAAVPAMGLTAVAMVFPVWAAGSGLRIERRSLLPLDRRFLPQGRVGPAPLITLPAGELLSRLVEEYVTAGLVEAATHAFAAENEARAAAMVRAKDNVAEMVEALRAEERRVRQEAITEEVVALGGGMVG